MSKHTNCPLTTHSFAWQRVGLVLSLSLMVAPLTPAITPMLANADELPTSSTEIVNTEANEPAVPADVTRATEDSEVAETAVAVANIEASEVENAAAVSSPSNEMTEADEADESIQPDAEGDVPQGEADMAEPEAEAAATPQPEALAAPLADDGTSETIRSASDTQATAAAAAVADETIPDITLLYEANDGTDLVKTGTVHEGTIVLPSADSLSLKAPAGRIFGGWYLPTKSTVHFYKAGDTLTLTKAQADELEKGSSPLALQALWLDPDQQEDATLGVAKTPVFFTSAPLEGGTLSDKVVYVPDSQETIMDSVVADPAPGYVFSGWYKDGEKVSEDPILDPTTLDGIMSTDEKSAASAVVCASFVPESEAEPQDEAPDLSSWRDPDSIARAQGQDEPLAGDENEGPTADDPNDERNTDKDTILEPSMDDPELLDQAAQSLSDPKFNEGATNLSDSANNAQVGDPAGPTDPANTTDDPTKTDDTPGSAATTTTTKTTTPYSSYSHYTASASSSYKPSYTSTTGTSGTSAYKASTYTPSTSSSYPYSAARTTQLAQTSDNALIALMVCMIGFVAAVAGIAFMAVRSRIHK